MKITLDVQDTGKISDGYHTFDELYDHRCTLYINLCLLQKERCCWRPDFDGWFILYLESDSGQISYHCPNKFLVLVKDKITLEDHHPFDGHTSSDVLARLVAEAIRKCPSPKQ